MFTGRQKIKKADGVEPTELEASIAQELFNLEVSATELKADLHDLYISAAKG